MGHRERELRRWGVNDGSRADVRLDVGGRIGVHFILRVPPHYLLPLQLLLTL